MIVDPTASQRVPAALRARAAAACALVVSVAFAGACQPPKAPATSGEKEAQPSAGGTGPVARVNGEDIPRGAFDRQLKRTRSRFKRAGREISPALEKRLKENMLRKLVEDALIRQKAVAEGVAISDADLEAKYKEHRARFGSEQAFKSFLERTNQTADDVKADLKKNLLRDALFARLMKGDGPTEADAKKYYDENKAKYVQREQIQASHILIKTNRDMSADQKKEKFKLAQKIAKEAKRKGADFAALAKKYSEGPTAKRGGDLGKFSRGRMVKPFEEAAFGAKAGQVVGPVETQFGYHIIKVFERFPERERSYDEVKDSILTSLTARQKSRMTREILANLKKEAKIEVLEPGLSLDTRARRAPVTLAGKPLAQTPALKRLKREAAARAGIKSPPSTAPQPSPAPVAPNH